jgi:phenylalanyl-tRNA synthetase alpha chain
MQLLIDQAVKALQTSWSCEVQLHRKSPIVTVADNYDRLHYPPDGAAREARYTRYVGEGALLRTQTSAMIPPLLRELSKKEIKDILLVCPGLVYRRDCIDRLHTGEPHQMDLWRIRRGAPLHTNDLTEMITQVMSAILPQKEWRVTAASHPYTTDGLQIDVKDQSEWIEVGECGLALPALLRESGLPEDTTGLAMGLGLDRLLMIRKGLDDIRLLRATEPRIASQMITLSKYRPVSMMPPVKRDLSVAVDRGTNIEELGDRVRAALGELADVVESIEILSETPYEGLSLVARERLQIKPGQLNLLLRVTLRSMQRTLTNEECNVLREKIFSAVEGCRG